MDHSRLKQWTITATAIASLTIGIHAQEQPSAGPDERWSSFLPFMKEEALSRGHDLPLPFGVSVVYNYLGRDIDVDEVKIGLNGAPPQSVSDYLDLGSNSSVNAAIAKVDVWLLPFLNVYGLFGYIDNSSTTKGHVTVPLPPPINGTEFDFVADTRVDGFAAGGGVTVAAGYRDFFLMCDANYSEAAMGFDDRFEALVISTRTGWNGKIGGKPTQLWLGGSYWDTDNTASSTIDVPGIGRVQFEADQGPRNSWNAVAGGSFEMSKRWSLFAEYGFNFDDVNIVATGLTYRF